MNIEIENAIKAIKANYPDSRYTELRKGLDLAIAALEKQLAKKTIDTEKGWSCPNCKNHIFHEQQLMHCRQCGQLVSWR